MAFEPPTHILMRYPATFFGWKSEEVNKKEAAKKKFAMNPLAGLPMNIGKRVDMPDWLKASPEWQEIQQRMKAAANGE